MHELIPYNWRLVICNWSAECDDTVRDLDGNDSFAGRDGDDLLLGANGFDTSYGRAATIYLTAAPPTLSSARPTAAARLNYGIN